MGLIKACLTTSNVQKVCKTCLEEKSDTVPLSSIIEFEDIDIASISIEDILARIARFEIDSTPLVSLICEDCLNELKITYLFLLKYEEAYNMLNTFLNLDIKDEETVTITLENDYENDTQLRKPPRKKAAKKETSAPRYEKQRIHPCPICPKEFTALELRDHAHTHKGLKKYLNIPASSKVTPTTKFATKRHLGVKMARERKHKCPYCGLEFTVGNFRLHIDVHRKQSEYKCDKCERVFKKLNHLNTHRVKHLMEFPYKCEQCGKGFVIKRNYDCHILTHTNEELPHECKYCFKRFCNPEHLNRHQIIHTENVSYSVKYRVCKCHHCLKSFKDRDELQNHVCVPIEQDTSVRFPCKQCKKIFKNATGLYNHNRNIHKLKGAKTLCSVCGNYVSNIYNHMMRHTGEKPFQCNQCEKRFIAKPQLKQHLLVHSGLKPYVCSVCAKAFNNLYNLQVHERIHKGDRCHVCAICGKGFLEKSYLKKHMNVHSKT